MADRLPRSAFRIILEGAMRQTMRRAKRTAATLEEVIGAMYDSGMTQEQILLHIFDTEAGRATFLDPIANSFGSSIKDNFQQIRHDTRDTLYAQNLPKNQTYRWVLKNVNNCEGCIARALGEARTLEEWEIVGLPQAGATECGKRCGCELVPEK